MEISAPYFAAKRANRYSPDLPQYLQAIFTVTYGYDDRASGSMSQRIERKENRTRIVLRIYLRLPDRRAITWAGSWVPGQMIIYKITNLVNGKVYIGKTVQSSKRRFEQHLFCVKQGLNTKLYNAMRKYGVESFAMEKIDSANTEEELNLLEQLYIAECDSLVRGYNMTLGGEGTSGYSPSEETRRKLAALRIGWQHSEETKRKQSQVRIGRPNLAVVGERHPSAKLTDMQRLEIWELYETTPTSLAEITRIYGINKASAYQVVRKFAGGRSLEEIGPRKRPHKLSEDQKEDIRRKYRFLNVTQRDLAREYGVTPTVINRVVSDLPKNDSWRHSENAPGASISDTQKIAMWEEYSAGGISQKNLASKYGVSEISVYRLLKELGTKHSKHAGGSHFNSRLTDEQRAEIVELWNAGGTTKRAIAQKFGISESRIGQLIRAHSEALQE
jgi:group I intron endonuclease